MGIPQLVQVVDGLGVALGASMTGTPTRIAGVVADTPGLAANTARLGLTVFNEQAADATTVLYVLLGDGPASATVYTIALQPGSYFEAPANYRGIMRLFFSAATGFAQVTELT